MPATDPVEVSYRELLNRIVPACQNAGPDSAEVAALVQLAKVLFPERAGQLDGVVGAFTDPPDQPITTAPQPAPTSPPSTSDATNNAPAPWSPWLTHGGTLSVSAIVVGVLSNWDRIAPYADSVFANPTTTGLLLALVALAGGLGGGLNGYLAGTSGFMPRMTRVGAAANAQGASVFLPGVLGNVLTGVIGAVISVWLPLWSHSSDPPTLPAYASACVAALMVGLFGSRFLTSQRDSTLAIDALQKMAQGPKNEELARQIGSAGSILKAVELLKRPQAGAPAGPTDVKAAEVALLSLFDSEALRANVDALLQTGKLPALNRGGEDVEIRALKVARGFAQSLPEAVQRLGLVSVARMDRLAFRETVAAAGATTAADAIMADTVLAAAQEAMKRLARMPMNWQLSLVRRGSGAVRQSASA